MGSKSKRNCRTYKEKFANLLDRAPYYYDLIYVLVNKDLKLRYKSSILGYLWSVANPLLYTGIFFVAFKIFMRIKIPNYTVFLISGLFPWQAVSNSIGTTTGVYIGNANLIKKLKFPKILLPISVVITNLVHFILSLVVLVFLLVINKIYPDFTWLWGIPFLFLLQFFITTGFSLIFSSINLFIRDIEYIVALLLNLIFYLTPIVYSESMIPEKYRFLVYFNPFAPLIICWRDILMHGNIKLYNLIAAFFYSLFIFLFGLFVYKKLEKYFAEVV